MAQSFYTGPWKTSHQNHYGYCSVGRASVRVCAQVSALLFAPFCLKKAKDKKEHLTISSKQTAVFTHFSQVSLGQWNSE